MRFKRIIAVFLIIAVGVGIFYFVGAGPPPPPPGDEDDFIEIEGTVFAPTGAAVSGATVTCGSAAISVVTDADGYYYLKFRVGTICHTNVGLTVPPYQLAAQHNDWGMSFVLVQALDEQIVWQDIRFEGAGGGDDPLDGIARVFVRVLDICTGERLDPDASVKAGWVQGVLVEDGWYKLEAGYGGVTSWFISASAPNHVSRELLVSGVSDTQKLYYDFTLWEIGVTSC
jgi:hypothetical protein